MKTFDFRAACADMARAGLKGDANDDDQKR